MYLHRLSLLPKITDMDICCIHMHQSLISKECNELTCPIYSSVVKKVSRYT